jgi:uncharacterized protein with GYD domain
MHLVFLYFFKEIKDEGIKLKVIISLTNLNIPHRRRSYMSKYLVNASYTAEGTRGLLKEGGTSRQQMVSDMAKKLGGKVEFFYYCFGHSDVVAIIEVPDPATAAAISMGIKATGAVDITMSVLISPSEIDAASKKSIGYRAPGN